LFHLLIAAQLLLGANVRELGTTLVAEVERSDQVFVGVVVELHPGKTCRVEVLPTEALKGELPSKTVFLKNCNRLAGRQAGVQADINYIEGEQDVFHVREGEVAAFVTIYSTRAAWLVNATRIAQVREIVRFTLHDNDAAQRTKTVIAWLHSTDPVLQDAGVGLSASSVEADRIEQSTVIAALMEIVDGLNGYQQRRALKALERQVKFLRARATNNETRQAADEVARQVEAKIASIRQVESAAP